MLEDAVTLHVWNANWPRLEKCPWGWWEGRWGPLECDGEGLVRCVLTEAPENLTSAFIRLYQFPVLLGGQVHIIH